MMSNDLGTWFRQIRQFLAPGAAEADADFRREILDLSHSSLKAIAGLEVVGPIVILVIRMTATSHFGMRAVLDVSTLIALGSVTLFLARMRGARPYARLAAITSIWLFGALLMLGSGGHLLAARVFGPGRYVPVYVAILVLLAVAMLPLRPGQTLALGSALELVYLAIPAGARTAEVSHHLFLVVLTVLSSAISAVIYQQRLATFRSHQATLSATRRALLAEGSASAGRLAAAVSHEFNSPLGALVSSVDTLTSLATRRAGSSQPLPERLVSLEQNLMRAVKDAAERLRRTVARLQRITNLDRADKRRVNIYEVLDDALAMLESQSNRMVRPDVVRQSQPDAPEVFCSPQQISAVFLSLLNDRAASAARGGGHIYVLTQTTLEGVEVQIRDDGPRIPAEEMSRMFDLHFRALDGRMSSANWSLFSCRQMIQEHGGELRIRSTAGEGTTLTVVLPAASTE